MDAAAARADAAPMRHITPSNVLATAAIFIALGGTGYAATRLPANSVGARQLRHSAVTRDKIAKNAVDSTRVRNGSLTGADIDLSSLGKVPSAAAADSAPISALQRVAVNGTNDPATPGGFSSKALTAVCPAGMFVVGGGAHVSDQSSQFVNDTDASAANAWTATVANGGGGTPGFTVTAVCASAVSATR
jgi:hypothetical protein